MADDKKLNRVQFFYEDGSSKFISGLELERWSGFLSQVTVMAAARGMNPDWSKVKWEEVTFTGRVLPEVSIDNAEEFKDDITKTK